MTKFSTIIFCTLILSLAVITPSCSSKSEENTPKTQMQGNALTVDGVVIRPEAIENIVRSSGTILASESVDLITEAAGRIEKITFKEGSHVRKNDLLVKINDDDLQAQLKKTKLQIQLASEQEKRQKQLYEINGISKEQYDIALNLVNTLKADRENLVASIRKREIRSPFDGIIGLRYISEGGYVSQTTRIASVQKINPLKVDFSIPEKYSDDVSVGDVINFSGDDTKLQFSGKLYAVEPKIDPVTRTLQLRALCDNKNEKIFPGAYVQIELRLKNIPDALMVPSQSIIPVLKGQSILVKRKGVVVSLPVKSGIRTASNVQILSGISAGDTVLTTGLMQARPGMPVNVVIH